MKMMNIDKISYQNKYAQFMHVDNFYLNEFKKI